MYTVQVKVLTVQESITYPPSELMEQEWMDICTVFQMDTDREELQEARKVANRAVDFYRKVRIVQDLPSGAQEVVR